MTTSTHTGDRTMLSRKDHKAIAKIVKKNTVRTGVVMVHIKRADMVFDLIDYFAQDNPQFNRERFLATCRL